MQTDLFGTSTLTAAQPRTTNAMDFLEKHRFSLRLDHALVGLIGLLVVYVLVFSFGVEQGKRFALAELKAERAKRELLAEQVRDKIFAPAPAGIAPGAVLEAAKPAVPAAAVTAPVSAPAAEIAPAAAVPAGYPAGKFTIQMVTFNSKQTAQRTIDALLAKGHQPFTIPSGKFLQVCLNSFETRDQASQSLKQLRAEKVVPADAFVRPIPQAA